MRARDTSGRNAAVDTVTAILGVAVSHARAQTIASHRHAAILATITSRAAKPALSNEDGNVRRGRTDRSGALGRSVVRVLITGRVMKFLPQSQISSGAKPNADWPKWSRRNLAGIEQVDSSENTAVVDGLVRPSDHEINWLTATRPRADLTTRNL
jgi:hypothetical protein